MFEPNTEKITHNIIIEFAKTMEMIGLSPLEARLFVHLYIEEKPMTLIGMSDALGRSKTSMSTSIRSLSDLNLVTRVWRKGERKDLYEANDQLFKTFISTFVNKWIDATNHQQESLMEIQKHLGEHNLEQGPKLNEQLVKIIDFHRRVESSFRDIK